MRLSWRRPVVLTPTMCPQKKPKERDTDPEEEQCYQQLRLRDAAGELGEAGGTLPWSLQRELSLVHAWISDSRLQNCKKMNCCSLGPGLWPSITATPDLEAGVFAKPPPPQEAPCFGGMNRACRVRDGLGEGAPIVPLASATRPAPS